MTEPDTTATADTTTTAATTTATADTTTTTTAPPPTLISPDGKLGENWFVSLGDELSPHAATLANFKDVKGLAKSYLHMRTHGPAYPDEKSSPDDIDRWRALAKVPTAPEGYGITAESLGIAPEHFDPEMAAEIAKAAHASHTPPAALAALAKAYSARMNSALEAQAKAARDAAKAAQDALVNEWRGDFEKNASTARHVAATLASTVGVEPEALAPLANNPAFARMMLAVSKLTAEDGTRTPIGFADIKSPQQQLDDIRGGRDPYWSPRYNSRNQSEQKAAYEHMERLTAQAAGGT